MDIKTFVEVGFILCGAIGSWFVLKYKVDNLKEIDEKQWNQISNIRDWIIVHEKDEATKRLDLERDLGRMREETSKHNGKMDTLISMIDNLTKKIEKLEEKLK